MKYFFNSILIKNLQELMLLKQYMSTIVLGTIYYDAEKILSIL